MSRRFGGTRPCTITTLAIINLLGLACDNSAPKPKPLDRVVRVVVVGQAKSDPEWAILQNTSQRIAKRYPLTVLEVRAGEDGSARSQRQILKALQHEKVDAVCIWPVDGEAIRQDLDALATSGTTVVTIGRDVPNSHRQTYCGPSEFEVGQKAAEAAGKILGPRNKTVMLLHAGDEEPVYGKRYFGFKQGMAQLPQLMLLREVHYARDHYEAVRLVKLESRMYPRVGGWVFLEDWPYTNLAGEQELLPLGMAAILCKASPKYWDRLRDGRLQALIAFDVHVAAEEAILAGIRLAQGDKQSVPSETNIPVEIITEKELGSFEARWRKWAQGMRATATGRAD